MSESGFFKDNDKLTIEEQKTKLKDNLLKLQRILRTDDGKLILQYIEGIAQSNGILDYMAIPGDKLLQALLIRDIREDICKQLKYIRDIQPDAVDTAVDQILSNH